VSLMQDEEKVKLKGEVCLTRHQDSTVVLTAPIQVHRLIAPRDQKYQSNFVEFKQHTKIVYRRYAGLFFCVCVDANDNELAYLEAIHFFVEVLDKFFGNVCELDLVFNFYKVWPDPMSSVPRESARLTQTQVYAILDEVFLAGEIEETSQQVVLTRLEHLDKLE
jgi:AP-2 complex subunit sigma-1